jgi:hypothetical protein
MRESGFTRWCLWADLSCCVPAKVVAMIERQALIRGRRTPSGRQAAVPGRRLGAWRGPNLLVSPAPWPWRPRAVANLGPFYAFRRLPWAAEPPQVARPRSGVSGGSNSLENRSPTRRNAKLSPRVDSHAACLWAQVCHARTPYPGYARLTRERTETITPSRPAACGWLSGTGDHGGNYEARLFFAFVGPVFRLVNEHAAGLALIGSGRTDRTGVGAGATNAGSAVRTQR